MAILRKLTHFAFMSKSARRYRFTIAGVISKTVIIWIGLVWPHNFMINQLVQGTVWVRSHRLARIVAVECTVAESVISAICCMKITNCWFYPIFYLTCPFVSSFSASFQNFFSWPFPSVVIFCSVWVYTLWSKYGAEIHWHGGNMKLAWGKHRHGDPLGTHTHTHARARTHSFVHKHTCTVLYRKCTLNSSQVLPINNFVSTSNFQFDCICYTNTLHAR